MYIPEYRNSWALVIGINVYRHISPLEFARHDAEAVAEILTEQFDFPQDNVTLLLDESATRDAIRSHFLQFANNDVDHNDRIFVFFAGHGHTQAGKRGEVGYLVPVDGTPDNLASLVRWDDFTRDADLIVAKHMLFIMDACYGGLAVTRAPGPGSMRFLKDMLQRYSRQVLTAGKADEVVADSGGPIPNHSVFTGHLMQALEGKAATSDGILSGNGVMAYVYDRVAKDPHSRQTPHYGFIAGDGDFIFTAPMLDSLSSKPEVDQDILIEIPPDLGSIPSFQAQTGVIERVKEYIPDPRYRIKLDALVTDEIRKVLYLTTDERFPVEGGAMSAEEAAERLTSYESITQDLQSIIVLLAYWGSEEQLPLLRKIVARTADNEKGGGGRVSRLALRWYPSLLLLYSAGIATLAADQYRNLSAVLTTPIGARHSGSGVKPAILRIIDEILEAERTNIFKLLPGHERHYVPRSEYLFKIFQPALDDLLFLGKSYETLFDRFEVFLALVYADLGAGRIDRIWGPPGRFAWKHSSRGVDSSPFNKVSEEARSQGQEWPPLKAGLFGGSVDRFQEVAQGYLELISQLRWF